MKNSTKIKNIRKEREIYKISDYSFQNLYNSFQSSDMNNKLKLKYSFKENLKLSNFRKNIILKINQIQNNQQKTNIKLSSLISILFSKLLGTQNYKIFHNHFSIIHNKKVQNITKIKKENIPERIKTENNQENNNTERLNLKSNNIKNKIQNISLASDIEIKRYNLSNQKTKSKENIFKLNNEKYNNEKEKEKEEIYNNSNNNLFRMNNNNYYNSLNKNPSSDNLNNSKKIFNLSNNRKPITFNDISTNLKNQHISKNKLPSNNNKINNNDESNDFKKIYINASNPYFNQNQNNYSINKEKDFNKSNISDNASNKAPVKIKFNSIEKPILLKDFNDSLNKSGEMNKNSNLNNIINISNNFKEQKNDKKYNNVIDNKGLSLKVEDRPNNLSYKKENMEINPESIRGKRKFSEARSEADSNYSNLSDAKIGQGHSRKIRGFNFRNNIKFNKKNNSNKISDEAYNKIKGGSVRYSNNNGLFEQINSLENEYK